MGCNPGVLSNLGRLGVEAVWGSMVFLSGPGQGGAITPAWAFPPRLVHQGPPPRAQLLERQERLGVALSQTRAGTPAHAVT